MAAPVASPSLANRMGASLTGAWRLVGPALRFAHVVGGVLILVGLAHLAAWQGPISLRKPTTFGISFGLTTITLAWVTGRPRIADHQPGGCCWARWPCAPPTPDSRRGHATQGDLMDLHHSDAIAAAQAMRDEFGS